MAAKIETHAVTSQNMAERLRNYLAQWIRIDADQAQTLLPYVKAFQCERQQVLFRPGDSADDGLALTRGLVRAYYLNDDDKEVNLRLLSAPVVVLPYASFLHQQPADEFLQALLPLEGFRIRFRDYFQEHEGLLAQTLQRLLAERHFLAMHNRLRMLQGKTAAERYAWFLKTMPPQVIDGTPGYHVASYLGITPESLSRLRRGLDKNQ